MTTPEPQPEPDEDWDGLDCRQIWEPGDWDQQQ